MFKLINKINNYRDFVLRTYKYAIAKKTLILKKSKYYFYFNNNIFISLINQTFLKKYIFYIFKHIINSNIKIKKLNIKIHNNFKYILLDFFK